MWRIARGFATAIASKHFDPQSQQILLECRGFNDKNQPDLADSTHGLTFFASQVVDFQGRDSPKGGKTACSEDPPYSQALRKYA